MNSENNNSIKNTGVKNITKDVLVNLFLLAIAIAMAVVLSSTFGKLYSLLFFNEKLDNSSVDFSISFIIGLVPAYIFFLTLLFTLFGRLKKYWWIFILLLPAAFRINFFISEGDIIFPISLVIIGWFIGWGILKLKNKSSS